MNTPEMNQIDRIVSAQTPIEKAEANVPETYLYADGAGGIHQGIRVVKDIDASKPGEYWWKLMLSDLLDLLEDISGKQTKALRAILEQFNPHSGIVLVNQKELAKQAGCSLSTVSRVIKLMRKHDLIDMPAPGVYTINPLFMSQGGKERFDSLLIQYRSSHSSQSDKALPVPSLHQKYFPEYHDESTPNNQR